MATITIGNGGSLTVANGGSAVVAGGGGTPPLPLPPKMTIQGLFPTKDNNGLDSLAAILATNYADNSTTGLYWVINGNMAPMASGAVPQPVYPGTDNPGFEGGTTYSVQIAAHNATGFGPYSDAVQVTFVQVPELQAQVNYSVAGGGTQAVLLYDGALISASYYAGSEYDTGHTAWLPMVSNPSIEATIGTASVVQETVGHDTQWFADFELTAGNVVTLTATRNGVQSTITITVIA